MEPVSMYKKRLILVNLSELYSKFKQENENVKIGFSRFAQLRPRHCVLAGRSGTHTVCVCVYHENVKLMLDAINIEKIMELSNLKLKDYHDCLKVLMCSEVTTECNFNECSNCPGVEILKKHLMDLPDKDCVEEIRFQHWQNTDRTTLVTEVANVDDFVDRLCEKIVDLKTHDFYAKSQTLFPKNLKSNLNEGDFLIMSDFAENYAYVIQNATQAAHWNNDQTSIFTVIVNYKFENEIKHISMAIISDNLQHDTVAVYVYQQIIIAYLKEHFSPKFIHYFTDGASQHFKNKYNFINLLHHKEDFNISADWNFHATAHGKGPCDGIGGNLKRLAARASLQRSSENQILNAPALYEWAKINLKDTVIFFSSKEDHVQMTQTLAERFKEAKTIPGTLEYHSFSPNGNGQLCLKRISDDTEFQLFPKNKNNLKRKNQNIREKCQKKYHQKRLKSKKKLDSIPYTFYTMLVHQLASILNFPPPNLNSLITRTFS
ncbi:uncharacterized protein LOC122498838 isoform X1 [Leptopilina heterotoma]|uniref:uncharacterized protein LOC122498838 isoform X1 n=1 Tax=Leptopilina heterotoma TaxID=63436 RepID=UPI001CA85F3C|nr:uncharacterized protein LOC122498838 isoform X1 [Leptopilina heterotoma]XP_043462734.1 uncharacterized protein LOC122498838 isoform X1 [Leptopilina heterotoma]